jgi:hypothetical protein
VLYAARDDDTEGLAQIADWRRRPTRRRHCRTSRRPAGVSVTAWT